MWINGQLLDIAVEDETLTPYVTESTTAQPSATPAGEGTGGGFPTVLVAVVVVLVVAAAFLIFRARKK